MFPRRIRLKASLLLAVFLSAGTTLPSLDGLLFHGGGEPERAQTHLEPAGGCLEHAEHCVLGRTAAGAGAFVASITEVRVAPPSPPAYRPTHPILIDADDVGVPNCRAPPVSLA
jgi:hypothetical protein